MSLMHESSLSFLIVHTLMVMCPNDLMCQVGWDEPKFNSDDAFLRLHRRVLTQQNSQARSGVFGHYILFGP